MHSTLPETNIYIYIYISPENRWLEDEFPFGMANFQEGNVFDWWWGPLSALELLDVSSEKGLPSSILSWSGANLGFQPVLV